MEWASRYFASDCSTGLRCVVSGEEATIHHLDGDATNHSKGNIVPLSGKRNAHLGTAYRYPKYGELYADLDPFNLLRQATIHCSNWKLASAYGCARLAAFIGGICDTLSSPQILDAARFALWIVRQKLDYDLIGDILNRDYLPRLAKIGFQCRNQTIYELASLLAESGEPALSSAALQNIKGNAFRVLGPVRQASVVRRRYLNSFTGHIDYRFRDQLADMAVEDVATGMMRSLSQGWELFSRGSFERGFETVLEISQQWRDKSIAHPRKVMIGSLLENEYLLACGLEMVKPGNWRERQRRAIDAISHFSKFGTRIPKFVDLPPSVVLIARNMEREIGYPISRTPIPPDVFRVVNEVLDKLLRQRAN